MLPGIEPHPQIRQSTTLTTAPISQTILGWLELQVLDMLVLLILQFRVVCSDKNAFLNLKMLIFFIYSVNSRQLQGE